MGINITTEKSIERLRVFSQLQDRESAELRRRLAATAQKLATRDGLDAQEVLEALMGDIASDLNEDGPPIRSRQSLSAGQVRRPTKTPPQATSFRPGMVRPSSRTCLDLELNGATAKACQTTCTAWSLSVM